MKPSSLTWLVQRSEGSHGSCVPTQERRLAVSIISRGLPFAMGQMTTAFQKYKFSPQHGKVTCPNPAPQSLKTNCHAWNKGAQAIIAKGNTTASSIIRQVRKQPIADFSPSGGGRTSETPWSQIPRACVAWRGVAWRG